MPGSPALARSLRRLDALLRDSGAPVARHWRPGLDAGDVHRRLAAVGLHPPDELVTWWGWHDGTDAPAARRGRRPAFARENALISAWALPDLDGCLALREDLREDDTGPPGRTGRASSRTWLPFLIFDDTVLACVDCAPDRPEPAVPRPVYVLDPRGEPGRRHIPRWPSIDGWVRDALTWFDAGRVLVDARGVLIDDARRRPPPEGLHDHVYW